jgi:hypothetical protein
MFRCIVVANFVVSLVAIGSFSYAALGDEEPAAVILSESKTLADFIRQASAARLPKNRVDALTAIRNHARMRKVGDEKGTVAGRKAIVAAAFLATKDADSDVRIAALRLIAATVRPWDADRESIADQVLALMPEKVLAEETRSRDRTALVYEMLANLECLSAVATKKHIVPLEKLANDVKVFGAIRQAAAAAICRIGGDEAKASLESLAKANDSQAEFKKYLDGLLDELDGFGVQGPIR